MDKKLKAQMPPGRLLQAFAAGRIDDDAVRARGFDPERCHVYHHIQPAKEKKPRERGEVAR